MQTSLADFVRDSAEGREAESILRACVHCGFCNAVCPTYQLLGEELDGPRGRIYTVKTLLEGEPTADAARYHLDRCLSCRACESACPSGVQYARLADIGRRQAERLSPRSWHQALPRRLLSATLPYPRRVAPWLWLARQLRPLLPRSLRDRVPPAQPRSHWPEVRHARRALVLGGCVQPLMAPATELAAARVFDRAGLSLLPPTGGCCGAMPLHLGEEARARALARRNIDLWWPHIEQGAEAVLVTASGCGAVVKDYGELLAGEPAYAERAARVARLARDPAELLQALGVERLTEALGPAPGPLAYQAPCTLQHAQRLPGLTEGLLERLGFSLTAVGDGGMCCGSAGTYSLLQPAISTRLRRRKLDALEAGGPVGIATSNIGCQLHLAAGTRLPVRHWLEWLAGRLPEGRGAAGRGPDGA